MTIRWGNKSNTANDEICLLAAGCKEGLIYIFNVKQATLWTKLDANDQQLGLRTMAFSPNNSMLAAGGEDNLIIWSIGQGAYSMMIKHFQRSNALQSGANYGGMGIAPGSGQSGNQDEHG